MLSVLSGLGQAQQAPGMVIGEALVIPDVFRCPSGTVPAISSTGEVTGCKSAPLVTAGAPGMAAGLPAWVPWVVGGVALLIFAGTIWGGK